MSARDNILRMAREAGFSTGSRDYADGSGSWPFAETVCAGSILPSLERFAELVAAAEREACAKICDEWNTAMMDKIAAAIRARKNKEATEN